MRIFVIGITGSVGRLAAQRLIREGFEVSGLVRQGGSDDELEKVGVRLITGDLVTMSVDELATALIGSDLVLFTAGAGGKDGADATTHVDGEGPPKVAAAAKAAGVNRFLLVSVFPEAWRERHMDDDFEHYMSQKKQAETHLVNTSLDWVILRPAALNNDPGLGAVDLGLSKIHVSIPREDVAATLVALIGQSSIRRMILEVTSGTTPINEAVQAFASPMPS
jgi:uncharacterized protein YbjT (DUF2867 family)